MKTLMLVLSLFLTDKDGMDCQYLNDTEKGAVTDLWKIDDISISMLYGIENDYYFFVVIVPAKKFTESGSYLSITTKHYTMFVDRIDSGPAEGKHLEIYRIPNNIMDDLALSTKSIKHNKYGDFYINESTVREMKECLMEKLKL